MKWGSSLASLHNLNEEGMIFTRSSLLQGRTRIFARIFVRPWRTDDPSEYPRKDPCLTLERGWSSRGSLHELGVGMIIARILAFLIIIHPFQLSEHWTKLIIVPFWHSLRSGPLMHEMVCATSWYKGTMRSKDLPPGNAPSGPDTTQPGQESWNWGTQHHTWWARWHPSEEGKSSSTSPCVLLKTCTSKPSELLPLGDILAFSEKSCQGFRLTKLKELGIASC